MATGNGGAHRTSQPHGDVEKGNVSVVTGPEFLIRLAEEGNLQRFEVEMERYPRLDVRAGPDVYYDRTPLHLAALHGQVEIVRWILRRSTLQPVSVENALTVVNAKDRFGYTPLHLAIRVQPKGQDAAAFLTEREEQREEVVRLLTTSSWVLPDRFIAATSTDGDEYDLCFEGFTPLHLAALTGNIPAVKLLLRQSLCRGEHSACDPVNIRATTWKGDSALDIAKRKGHVHLVELLECFDLTGLQSERERNANSMNAVLVGAALVVAATFATWLQPPLGIPDPVPHPLTPEFTKQSNNLALFFLFVAIAFGLSTVALVIGIVAMIPFARTSLKSEVRLMRKALRRAAFSLFVAIICLSFAFLCASVLVFERVSFAGNDNSNTGKFIILQIPLVTTLLIIYFLTVLIMRGR